MIGFLRHLRAFLSAPSRKKFFTHAFSRGVADAVAHEYYSHCRRVSWLGLFGKPVRWREALSSLARISPITNPNQGGLK